MMQIEARTILDREIDLASDDIAKLKARLRGPLLQAGEPGYEESRTVWNAMIDRKPAMIVRCRGVSDIRRALDFAQEHGILTAIRGGGHNIAGNALCDAGMVIDLSALRSVRIDPYMRRAYVEPGVTLGEFDREAQAFGLMTPLGINSTTGVAGLTLGGGFGWSSRKYGLASDNLISADVITADNKFVRVPASGRDLLSRRLSTVVFTCSVSPWNTGLGKRVSVMPRFATVVPSVVSLTDIPIVRPSVNRLLTSGRLNSVVAAKCASRCSGCGFIVSDENSTLSVSVTVRVHG